MNGRLLHLCLFALLSLSTQVRAGDQRIVVTLSGEAVSYGAFLEASVCYENGSEDPWTIMTPEDSVKVNVHLFAIRTQRDSVQHLGKYQTVCVSDRFGGHDLCRVEVSAKPLVIAPGKSHTFRVEFDTPDDHRAGLWIREPGRYEVWVTDENSGIPLQSNKCQFLVAMTEESVRSIVSQVSDLSQVSDGRNSHRDIRARWLARIDPSMEVDWPKHSDSPLVLARKRVAIRRTLRDFKDFWRTNHQHSTIQNRIDDINKQAGLPSNVREMVRVETVVRESAAMK